MSEAAAKRDAEVVGGGLDGSLTYRLARLRASAARRALDDPEGETLVLAERRTLDETERRAARARALELEENACEVRPTLKYDRSTHLEQLPPP